MERLNTTDAMTNEIRKYANINIFVIVFNGSNPRFDFRKNMMKKLIDIFGKNFLQENAVFAVTNWHFDKEAVKTREKTSTDENSWKKNLTNKLEEFEINNNNVPVAFIDAHHGNEVMEKEQFRTELAVMEKCLKEGTI